MQGSSEWAQGLNTTHTHTIAYVLEGRLADLEHLATSNLDIQTMSMLAESMNFSVFS